MSAGGASGVGSSRRPTGRPGVIAAAAAVHVAQQRPAASARSVVVTSNAANAQPVLRGRGDAGLVRAVERRPAAPVGRRSLPSAGAPRRRRRRPRRRRRRRRAPPSSAPPRNTRAGVSRSRSSSSTASRHGDDDLPARPCDSGSARALTAGRARARSASVSGRCRRRSRRPVLVLVASSVVHRGELLVDRRAQRRVDLGQRRARARRTACSDAVDVGLEVDEVGVASSAPPRR